MKIETKGTGKDGFISRLLSRKDIESTKDKASAPKAESPSARIAAFISYLAPAGATLSKIFIAELVLPQVLFLIATPIAVYLDKTWSKRREAEAKNRGSGEVGRDELN